MSRTRTAFVVAPLWVPLAMFPVAKILLFPYPEQHFWVATTVILSAIFGYAGVFMIGIPSFVFLRSRNFISPWIAIALGFVVGTIVFIVFVFLFAIVFQYSAEKAALGALKIFHTWDPIELVWPGVAGSIGSLVGITLWLISRPDRN